MLCCSRACVRADSPSVVHRRRGAALGDAADEAPVELSPLAASVEASSSNSEATDPTPSTAQTVPVESNGSSGRALLPSRRSLTGSPLARSDEAGLDDQALEIEAFPAETLNSPLPVLLGTAQLQEAMRQHSKSISVPISDRHRAHIDRQRPRVYSDASEQQVTPVAERYCSAPAGWQFEAAASLHSEAVGEAVEPGPIGCGEEPLAAHSSHLLPAEVLLFEPTVEDIFSKSVRGKRSTRHIFLNQPLTDIEVSSLAELRGEWEALTGDPELPDFAGVQALRLLQHVNFSIPRALQLIQMIRTERVGRLPLTEESVLEDLRSGFMYLHGRDRRCRPCVVIRLARMGEMQADMERAVRLVIFVLEYAIRYAMVPGRVENWVVVLDLENVMQTVSMLHLSSHAKLGLALGKLLETVYCERMVWMMIVNLPGNKVIGRLIESLIPAEKKAKVKFPTNIAAAMRRHFEPGQLEARYGGTAPDLAPEEAYPFRFFPNARGPPAASLRAAPKPPSASSGGTSWHALCDRSFHTGTLWDRRPEAGEEARWLSEARSARLPPASAAGLSQLLGRAVLPCSSMDHWLQLASGPEPRAEQQHGERRALTELPPARRSIHRDPGRRFPWMVPWSDLRR